MPRSVYVNGRYLPYVEAGVHVEDRGFQFADAVYEVAEVMGGRLIDEARHLARLERSLSELGIAPPMGTRALGHVMREVIRRNRVSNGLVYLQVTRGQAARDFPFPADAETTLVVIARALDPDKIRARAEAGISVITMPDIRWGRCDIKTVMLLPACLAKETAREQGAGEAWFLDRDGFVTEGASSNAWIVDGDGRLVTRPLGRDILPGITRRTLLDLIAREGLTLVERAFTREEALRAREAFVTSASATVMPVVRVDGTPIGDGKPGPLTRLLRQSFHQVAAVSGP